MDPILHSMVPLQDLGCVSRVLLTDVQQLDICHSIVAWEEKGQ